MRACGEVFKTGQIEVCSCQNRTGLFGEVGEENNGFGIFLWRGGQHGVVAGGVKAENDFGARACLNAQGVGADGDAPIAAHFKGAAQAPDEGPPGALGNGAEGRAFFFEGQLPGLIGFHFDFAVNFILVAREGQGLDMEVGLTQVRDFRADELSGQALLPYE